MIRLRNSTPKSEGSSYLEVYGLSDFEIHLRCKCLCCKDWFVDVKQGGKGFHISNNLFGYFTSFENANMFKSHLLYCCEKLLFKKEHQIKKLEHCKQTNKAKEIIENILIKKSLIEKFIKILSEDLK